MTGRFSPANYFNRFASWRNVPATLCQFSFVT
jgi:hypothetical protein